MKHLLMVLLISSSSLNAQSTKECVKEFITNHAELKFKGIVFKQLCLETGHFKSKRFKDDHNAAGIRYNKRGYCIGKRKGYGVYDSWENCIADYVCIQKRIIKTYKCKTDKDYLRALVKAKYALDKAYVKLVLNCHG
jgi:uncharacterized FlgJ-related protein